MRPRLPHVGGLDGLRAVAVIAVILFHLELAWAAGGFLGVDVFFVISGYLITSQLWARSFHGRVNLARFWQARARRLLPALLLEAIDAVPASATLVLVTPRVPRPWMGPNVATIRAAAKQRPGVALVDWARASEGHPDYVGADGVHMTMAGITAYTKSLAASASHGGRGWGTGLCVVGGTGGYPRKRLAGRYITCRPTRP